MQSEGIDGYLALPAAGTGDPVLVLHPWWGLNGTIKDVCARLAEAGFAAFAPDLYRGVVADTIEDAQSLTAALDNERAHADVTRALTFLAARAEGGIAIVGFSMGAYFALEASRRLPEAVRAVVLFYGTGEVGDYSAARAAYLGHFAGNDPYESAEYVQATEATLRDAQRPVRFFHYPGTAHWFFEPDRPEYDATASSLAWERTLDFLNGEG